ncbi:MAG: nucleotidyltransferase family protein [Chlorobaculum sp.]|nr:nucleotidyltransferase family protein [Chlorobaculum sp.]
MNEDKFIIKASALNPADDDLNLLRKLAKNDIDWSVLYKKASMHGVTPLMYYTLTKYSLSDIIPQESFADFKRDYYQTAIRNTNLLQLIDRVAKRVKKKIILLKGADLAQYLYPNIGIRSMCDIDILVNYNEAEWIRELLVREKEALSPPKILYKSKIHEKIQIFFESIEHTKAHLDPVLFREGRIEIHRILFCKNIEYSKTEKAWESIIPIKNNEYIYRLSTEFMLVHLCEHICRHAIEFSYLRMYCDVNELIRKNYSDIDWEFIYDFISGTELEENFFRVMTYVRSIFNTPLPEEITTRTRNIQINIELHNLMIMHRKRSHENVINNFNIVENPIDKIIYLYRTICPEKEWLKQYYNVENINYRAYYKYWVLLLRKI